MVHMVHTNVFYRMGLEICDSKSEFWTKTENSGFLKNIKIQFWCPKLIFEGLSKDKMAFKNILDHSGVIPAQSPYIKILF